MIKWLLMAAAALTVATCLLLGLAHGIQREEEMRDAIRKERCAKYGENLPKSWESYCEELGV